MNNNNKSDINEKQLNKVFDPAILKVISEPVRVEIIKLLSINGTYDITTIAEHFDKDRSVISKHLKIMYEAGFLLKQKEGRHTYYYLDGMALLFSFENIVNEIKGLLSVHCSDSYNKLYSSKKTYGEFVKENNINLIENIKENNN